MRSENGDGLSKGNKWKTPRTEAQERGGVAQLVERLPCKQEASGSNPLISTNPGKRGDTDGLIAQLVRARA